MMSRISMPEPIEQPTIVSAAGGLQTRFAERLGRVDAAAAAVSVARMECRAGWPESGPTRNVPIRNLRLAPGVEKSLPANLAFGAVASYLLFRATSSSTAFAAA